MVLDTHGLARQVRSEQQIWVVRCKHMHCTICSRNWLVIDLGGERAARPESAGVMLGLADIGFMSTHSDPQHQDTAHDTEQHSGL